MFLICKSYLFCDVTKKRRRYVDSYLVYVMLLYQFWLAKLKYVKNLMTIRSSERSGLQSQRLPVEFPLGVNAIPKSWRLFIINQVPRNRCLVSRNTRVLITYLHRIHNGVLSAHFIVIFIYRYFRLQRLNFEDIVEITTNSQALFYWKLPQ